MTAKNRPRRISEATKTYNVLFPVALLETIHREADLRETSSAQLVRTAIEEYLLGNTQKSQSKQVTITSAVWRTHLRRFERYRACE